MIVNADIGERGADHPVDRALMAHIGQANIACGGHAGDESSIEAFLGLALEHEVQVAAHPSYPDRENFGRVSMDLSPQMLVDSLGEQLDRLPGVRRVKLHGALYNDACVHEAMAKDLALFLKKWGALTVVAPAGSALALACEAVGLELLSEAFVERRYHLVRERLLLVPRSHPKASIEGLDDALAQARSISAEGWVQTLNLEDSSDGPRVPIEAETLCIHSDAPLALPLAQALEGLFG